MDDERRRMEENWDRRTCSLCGLKEGQITKKERGEGPLDGVEMFSLSFCLGFMEIVQYDYLFSRL